MIKKTFFRLIAVVLISMLTIRPIYAQTPNPQPGASPNPNGAIEKKIDWSANDINYYGEDSACTGASNQPGGEALDGYTLPATSGRTGFEEAIDAGGHIPSGGRVTFAKWASKGQEYQDYYITMRWNYTSWNWNGTNVGIDNKQFNWFNEKPRLVLVTNGKNSIIAVAMEAGPAPWTGADTQPNNNPKQGWSNPQKGTPSGYKGRVSGFPPKAIKALNAHQGMADGSGDVLTYAWAADQNAKPGPVTGGASTAVGGNPQGCADNGQNGNAFIAPNGYAMPIGLPKKDISNGYRWPCPGSCHHDGTAAFDLAHKDTVPTTTKDNLTAGVPEFAIIGGKMYNSHVYNHIPGCYSFHIMGDDGWDYYYTHTSSPIIKENQSQKVTVGQKVSVVGRRDCTGNGSYPHLHIDRGSPKGRGGGEVCCRDSGFTPLMNAIYAAMSDNPKAPSDKKYRTSVIAPSKATIPTRTSISTMAIPRVVAAVKYVVKAQDLHH